jgi:cytochrome b subunit of formate dehydrogenase
METLNQFILRKSGLKFFFGKYRGKYIDYVIDTDISYCKWIVNNMPMSNEAKYIMQSRVFIEKVINKQVTNTEIK